MANPKILIVDDEPFNVDYLQQELEEAGYETTAAANGQEALRRVTLDAPDLILLDIMMPIMDGFQVLSYLKANPCTRDIPVIIISANNDLSSVAKGIQLGAEDYLPKPFEPILLHARISSSIEKKRLRDLEHIYLKGLERELAIGREIQMGFLPTVLPKADGWEIAAYMKAAREVAGDFYDCFLLPDGCLVCVVGDVCGKGVGAALFMTLFRSLIRATSTTDYLYGRQVAGALSPTQRLRHVITFTNQYVSGTHGEANMFATVFMGILNLTSGTLTYANCGNEPPLLIRKAGAVTELPSTGAVVGLMPDLRFSVQEISMEEHDLLLSFTDGIPDALDRQNVPFGRERLSELLKGSDRGSVSLIERIDEQLRQFMGNAEQFDDMTMLAVQRVP